LPKVFDTLLVLIERDGRVASKAELMEAIWADAFVEESNLSQNIYTLRRTLGVDEQGKQLIETVPRRGYRFAVPVRTVTGESATGTGRPREAVPQAVAGSNVVQVEQTLDTSAPVLGNYSPVSTTGRPAGSTSGQGQQRWTSRYAVWTALVVVVGSALALVIGRFVVLRKDKGESTTAPIEQVRFQKLTDSGDV